MNKIIHFCWFGKNKKSELIERCIASWKIHLSDYQIMEWNEDSFDITSNKYVQQAYENKKWAFVSDYVRLYALHHHGGIYLDTDVEVFKSLDEFLVHDFFTGFELYQGHLHPITAVMGASKGSKLITRLLSFYQNREFILSNGQLDLTTNTSSITKILVENYNIDRNKDAHQFFNDEEDIHVYPSFYFCNKTNQSFTMHHFDGSWRPKSKRFEKKLRKILHKVEGRLRPKRKVFQLKIKNILSRFGNK